MFWVAHRAEVDDDEDRSSLDDDVRVYWAEEKKRRYRSYHRLLISLSGF
jgi:hypothetical protein